jgi:phospholipid/cholesterol/gamma-HCH transport system substrate-binding protein
MTHTPAEVALGGAVLAAALSFGVYAMTHGGPRLGGDSYQLTASFRSVEGISVGSDVRLAGVKVGSVTDIALNPQTFRADTVVTLDSDVRVPDDSAIIIASEGLLGGSYVEISPGGSPFNYDPGAEILDTQGAVSLFTLLMRYFSGGEG